MQTVQQYDKTMSALLRPKPTTTDPPTANSPTMHSRLVCTDQKIQQKMENTKDA